MINKNSIYFLNELKTLSLTKHHSVKRGDKINPFTGILENSSCIRIDLDLPMFKKDEIDVSIEEKIITVYGAKITKQEPTLNQERHISEKLKFLRSFVLPASIDRRRISILHEDKILTLNLPKVKRSN